MKNIYLSIGSILFISTLLVGQSNSFTRSLQPRLEVESKSWISNKKNNTKLKAPGQTLFSEDFTTGFPAGWSKGGTSNNGAEWTINNSSISAQFTTEDPLVSTSGGNHMLYFGDQINAITPIDNELDAWIQTPGITLNGAANFSVRFEQQFRLCCNGESQLNMVISEDPTFATNTFIYNASGSTPINSQAGSDQGAQIKTINITENFGGSSATIYIRFHWTVASHYYWMLDDISVIESNNNDLTVFSPYHGSNGINYTKIPDTQIQPIDFSMKTTNIGAVEQHNAILTTDINSGAFNFVSLIPKNIPAVSSTISISAASDSLFSTQWTPPSTPLNTAYNIDLTITSDSTDINPSDNTIIFSPLEITEWTYAQDDYDTIPDNGGGYNNEVTPPSEDFEAGNFFDIISSQRAAGIEVAIPAGPSGIGIVDAIFDVVLYDFNAAAPPFFTLIERSEAHVVTAADTNNTVFLKLKSGPTLIPGRTYFAAVHGWGSNRNVIPEFFYGVSGSSYANPADGGPGATSLIYYPNMISPNPSENFYTTRTPMVRLILDPSLINAVDENKTLVNFNVYPNPSVNGLFNINLNTQFSNNTNLTVTNILGKTIIDKIIPVSGKTTETLSLTGYSKGIYFLTIDNKTIKLILE